MPIRSQMSSIMGQIEPEDLELFALEFGKFAEYDIVYTIIYKYWPNITKLGQDVCDHKILHEFHFGPWNRKIAIFDCVYTQASANMDQSVPNLVTIYMPIKSLTNSIMGQIEPEHLKLFVLEFGKVAESDFVYTLASTNINQSAPTCSKYMWP